MPRPKPPHRRGLLLALLAALPWAPSGMAMPAEAPRAGARGLPVEGYSSEAIRRRAEEEAQRREAWWARQRQREQADRVTRELERRRDRTSWQVERWEEQRQRRLWGRRDLWP